MRASILLFGVALAGCGGTGFTAGVTQTVEMHLGRITGSCNTVGAAAPVTFLDGSSSTFVHQTSGGDCVMITQWRGPLLDMDVLRQRIANDEPDADKGLANLEIRHLDIDIDHIRFRDASNNTDIERVNTDVASYSGALAIASGPRLISFDFVNDNTSNMSGSSSNANHPHRTLSNEASLMSAANADLAKGNANIMGGGNVVVHASSADLSGFEAARDPSMQLILDVDVNGGKIR